MRQMLDHASAVLRITEGKSDREITGDFVLWNAVLHLLQNVGEAASRLEPDERARRAEVPWRDAIDMRNFLAHGYDTVKPEVVLRTLKDDIPPLIQTLEILIVQVGLERAKRESP